MKDFRQCLGKFATGITVVTCSDDAGRPYGITANSFSSVSLVPHLVLWNIAKVSNSLGAFLEAGHFAINILALGQQDLATHFAKSDHTLFDALAIDRSVENVPLIPGALADPDERQRLSRQAGASGGPRGIGRSVERPLGQV